jgi:hypothetical protein
VRVGHPFGGADGIAFDKAIDDLGPAGELRRFMGLALFSVCSMIDIEAGVNGSAYMDFKEATDLLFERVDHETLAEALSVSVATIRQARLRADAGAYRSPPTRWRVEVARLARVRVAYYQNLIENLKLTADEHTQSQASDSYLHAKNKGKSDSYIGFVG